MAATKFKRAVLLSVALCLAWIQVSLADDYCTPDLPLDDQPKFPQPNFKAFTTEYKVYNIDEKKTISANKSYDKTKDKLRIETLDNGKHTTFLYDFSDNTYIQFHYDTSDKSDYKCKISELGKTLTKSDLFDLFGFIRGDISKTAHSSSKVLSFSKDDGYVYKGKADINQLPVDHWRGCLKWDQTTFTVDYYLAGTKFQPVSTVSHKGMQVPVRAVVKGEKKDGKTTKKINHIYDYLNFKPMHFLDETYFSLPDFIDCSGNGNTVPTKWHKEVPSVPKSMSYFLEKVVNENSGSRVTVDSIQVYVDGERRLVQIDGAQTKSISDFNTGVEYVINTDGCSPRPIDPHHVESAIQEGGYIKMKDRPEVSYINPKLFYSGLRNIRSWKAHSFTGSTNEEQVEVFFVASPMRPVKIKVTNKKSSTLVHYNIFDFSPSPHKANEKPFDIRQCRDSKSMTSARVIYHVSNIDTVKQYRDQLIERFRDAAAKVAGVSTVLVCHDDIIIDSHSSELHWLVSFLDSDPKDIEADVVDKTTNMESESIYIKVDAAIKNGNFEVVFKGATLTGKGIYSDSVYTSWSAAVGPMNMFEGKKNQCVKKFKADHEETTTSSKQDCARKCLDSTSPCNFFQYTELTKSCEWSSGKIQQLVDTPGCTHYEFSPLSHFRQYQGNVILEKDGAVYKIVDSDKACARLCLKATEIDCQSFDFCAGDKRCLLHSANIFSSKVNLSESDQKLQCSHFSRHYFDSYHQDWKKEAMVEGVVKAEVESAARCAYMCSTYEEGCEMFTYCQDSDDKKSCSMVPLSKQSKVTIKENHDCWLFKSVGVFSIKKKAKAYVSSATETADDADCYTGGSLAGVAVAMIIAGVGAGALAVFLLRRFRGWQGFR